MTPETFDLGAAFAAKQQHMLAGLGLISQFSTHPGTKGTSAEERWRAVLESFLPRRYGIDPAFIIDSKGGRSEQIDLAIYDRQYSPLIFEEGATRFIPAESVYAVCEVKQVMNKQNLEYARRKIASARVLHRTSAPVRHVGGTYPPQNPAEKPILGVFLSTKISWTNMATLAAQSAISATSPERIDLGIAVNAGAFDHTAEPHVAANGKELIWFMGRLFQALGRLGTALAVDFDAYYAAVEAISPQE